MIIGSFLPFSDVLFFFVLCGVAIILALVTLFLILFSIFDKTASRKALFSIIVCISFVLSALGMQSLVHYNRKK